MTTNSTPGAPSGAISAERSPKVTDLRAPAFGNERASSLLGLAKGAVRRGEHRLAARLFGRALEKEPDNVEATLGLASAELMLGDGPAAERHAYVALEQAPNAPDPRLILANLRIAQERHQEAIQLLRDAITVDPDFAPGFSRLGTILTALGEHAAAKPILLRALALDPTDADALNSIGNVVLILGDTKGAALHFERAIAANPGWMKPRMNLATALERLGRPDDAMDALKGALAQDPRHIEAKVYLAGLLQRTGNPRRALHLLEDVVEVEPEHVGALFLIGLIHMQADEPDQALAPLEKAAELAPGSNDIRVNLACAYRGVDRHEEAFELAKSAVEADSSDILALNTLGSVLMDVGQEADAIPFLEKAIESDPNFHVGLINLATALLACDRGAEAVPHLEKALALGAPRKDVLRKLGVAYRDQGNLSKAEINLRLAVETDPRDSRALYALSALLERLDRASEIGTITDDLIARDSDLVHAYVVKALAADTEDALATINKALAIDPDNVDALLVAGTLNDSTSRPEIALAHYERALELNPDSQKAMTRRTDIVLSLCDWERRRELVAQARESLAEYGSAPGIDVFNLQALDVSYAEIATAASTAAADIETSLKASSGDLWVPRVASSGSRIRIGYLLPYTWFHSLPMVLRHIVEAHDRDAFEVVGFATNVSGRNEPFEQLYRNAFDSFHSLVGLSAKQAARRIGACGIDILIEVSGHTSISSLPVAAFRPAPVQVHLLGYSITTGASFIDYLITDQIYVPRDQAALGTEHPVYLPNSFMPALRQPISADPVSREKLGLPDDAFVMANFNHPCKFEPESFGAWMEILKRVPDAVLWLGHWFEATKNNLIDAAAAEGIDRERLIFAPITEHPNHLRRLSEADLAVDNFLHGGGITTIDALRVGVPVLSKRGATPSSRLGATLLHAIGLDDMVVETREEYVERAVALATDDDARTAMRKRLTVNVQTHPLFDFAHYVGDLERAYKAIWARHQNGQAPALIDLKDTV